MGGYCVTGQEQADQCFEPLVRNEAVEADQGVFDVLIRIFSRVSDQVSAGLRRWRGEPRWPSKT